MSSHPGPPAGTPDGTPGTAFTGTAGLGARIGARLLDILLVAIPALIVLSILGLGGMGLDRDTWLGSAITSALWFGYFVFFESNRGATIGKRILNLRVIDSTGANPPVDVAAKRNIWMLLGLIPVLGGLIWFVAVIVIIVTIGTGTHNRGKHDEFAGTAVMRA